MLAGNARRSIGGALRLGVRSGQRWIRIAWLPEGAARCNGGYNTELPVRSGRIHNDLVLRGVR